MMGTFAPTSARGLTEVSGLSGVARGWHQEGTNIDF
jgi:hypothetical protein